MTGARWRSALVALLFAIHPLRVEAVVWITARKNVLSGLFWMLAMLAYVRYAERPVFRRYAWIPVLMLLGLLCKAILIALPPADRSEIRLDLCPHRASAADPGNRGGRAGVFPAGAAGGSPIRPGAR